MNDSSYSKYESKLWIKHISNGMSLMPTLYSYSLQPVLINQSCSEHEWNRVVKCQYC